MKEFKLVKAGKIVKVIAEFNPDFMDEAYKLDGSFRNDEWIFDIRDYQDVVDICYKYYGDNGVNKNQCDVKVTVLDTFWACQTRIVLFGRVIATAVSRDSGARKGVGVILKAGQFLSAGSIRNWVTEIEKGTVFIVRDVSKFLVDEYSHEKLKIEIVGINAEINKVALAEEKERLVNRLFEINKLLEEN